MASNAISITDYMALSSILQAKSRPKLQKLGFNARITAYTERKRTMKTQLKSLRKLAGYKTQPEMAAALSEYVGFEVPALRYADWERGDTEITLAMAYQITELLGCTLDELVGRDVAQPQYSDPHQKALNACYENMNEDGKQTLVKVARSLEFDISNRMEKKKPEGNTDLEQMAG